MSEQRPTHRDVHVKTDRHWSKAATEQETPMTAKKHRRQYGALDSQAFASSTVKE